MPLRTIEAIKGKRRQNAYKAKVQLLLADMIVPRPQDDPVLVPQAIEQIEAPRDVGDLRANEGEVPAIGLEEEADDYYHAFRPDYELDELKMRLQTLGFILNPNPPEIRLALEREDQRRAPDVSARKRKKLRYAKTQNLYYKDRAEALKIILEGDGYVERIRPSNQVVIQWKEYLNTRVETPPIGDARILRVGQDLDAITACAADISLEEITWALNSFKSSTAAGIDGMRLSELKAIRREDLRNIANEFFRLPIVELLNGRVTLIPRKRTQST